MDTADRRLGRPTKLNRTIARRLIEMFALGASQADACRYAGISPDSLQRWIAAGRAEPAAIEARDEGEYECSDAAVLVMAIDRALGQFARRNLVNIKRAAPQDWRAALALLERRFPREWGKREQVDHTHVLVAKAREIAEARGLDEAATETLVNYVLEREKRRPA